jgi:hypothetical protein
MRRDPVPEIVRKNRRVTGLSTELNRPFRRLATCNPTLWTGHAVTTRHDTKISVICAWDNRPLSAINSNQLFQVKKSTDILSPCNNRTDIGNASARPRRDRHTAVANLK